MTPPPEIVAAIDAATLRTQPLRLDLRWHPSVGSTMDIAAQVVDAGAPEGVVIVADEQTAGRGRRGHTWSSPPGAGLYLSLVLRPPLEDRGRAALPLLTLAAGVAVREALARVCDFDCQLKWPNDIMVGPRKLAGLLAEGIGIGTPAQRVVLGVGINMRPARHPDEVARRATSIEAELGRPVGRGPLLEEVLVQLCRAYHALLDGQADDILRAWRAAAPSAQGAIVEWDGLSGHRRGTTAGIDSTGALLVDTPEGRERVMAGEIIWC
jgi:BirA family transcriptional regulator, biotin operon repressor / biotin---[acetyl-CoA-carboxylase] ligase